ncbi:MAG: hypothetical protein ABJA61_01365 [Caldimonas sp.]
MKIRLLSALILAFAASSPLLAVAAAPVKTMGGMMVTSDGMTLYTFDRDAAGNGKSMCNGPCATLWPPVIAAPDAKAEGEMTIITRDDGARQWAYKGKPVYLYSVDKKAGDATGDNFRDVWHVIKP